MATKDASPPATYRDFYESYLDDIQDPGPTSEWFNVKCPFHDDSKASAGISKKTGMLHCFTEDRFWSPAEFVAEFAPMPIEDATRIVDEFRIEYGLIVQHNTFTAKAPLPNARFNRLYELSKRFMSPNQPVVKEYMAARGIRYQTLIDLGVGFLPAGETHDGWNRDSLVFPYLHDGNVVGIRYRDFGGNKGGELGCYFTLWGIDRLDDDVVSDVIIVCEGETDACRVHQAVGGKYTVVCTPTATFKKEWRREFQGSRQVILIPQDDDASMKMVEKARAAIVDIEVLWLPWGKKEYGKDVVDWLRYHTEENLLEEIEVLVKTKARRVMTGHEFKIEASKPREWFVNNLLSRQQICIIGGPPKARKTFAALNIVRSLLTGEPVFGIPAFVPSSDIPPKMLIWEEEGPEDELLERANLILGGTGWEDHTFWAHQLGIKLDADDWMIRLSKEINEYEIDLLILDPFSRMYSADEDNSGEMGKVWSRVASLMNRHRRMSIIILHHFTKTGAITDGFTALRGSSRNGAEADLGIFMEKRTDKVEGARMRIEGRSIRTPTAADGSEVFKLTFNEGLLTVEAHQVVAGKNGALFQECMNRGGIMHVSDAVTFFKVSASTLRDWVKKAIDPDTNDPLMLMTKDSPKIIKIVNYDLFKSRMEEEERAKSDGAAAVEDVEDSKVDTEMPEG